MASYSIYSKGTNSVTIKVTGVAVNTQIRVYVRLKSDSNDTSLGWGYFVVNSDPFYATRTGLSANTEYTINCGYLAETGTDLWGPQYFTTLAEEVVEEDSEYGLYIHHSGEWKKTESHIHNGSSWGSEKTSCLYTSKWNSE